MLLPEAVALAQDPALGLRGFRHPDMDKGDMFFISKCWQTESLVCLYDASTNTAPRQVTMGWKMATRNDYRMVPFSKKLIQYILSKPEEDDFSELRRRIRDIQRESRMSKH